MTWLPLAVFTAVAFGLYNVFIKLGSKHIDHVLGAVILQFVAAACGVAYALWLRFSAAKTFDVSREGVAWATAAGIAVGLAEILSFVVYSRGAPTSLGTPIIMGGAIMVAGVIGVLALKENLSLIQIIGVVLVVVGIGLMSRTGA